jgi:hypothetical protein
VNRVAQELRGQGLIAWEWNTLTILDWEGLVALGEFKPTYLHLTHKRAA